MVQDVGFGIGHDEDGSGTGEFWPLDRVGSCIYRDGLKYASQVL